MKFGICYPYWMSWLEGSDENNKYGENYNFSKNDSFSKTWAKGFG